MTSPFQSNSTSLFGNKPASSTFPTFGSAATTQSTSLFQTNKPTFGQLNTTQFSFATPATNTTSSAFPVFTGQQSNFNLNQKPIFGSSSTTQAFNNFSNTGFGMQTNTNQSFNNQPIITEDELFIESISQPSLCGDERDIIISRWNQLQAMWGFGSGLSSKGKATYSSDNYLARFKSVSYNQVPTCDDNEGFVSLLIKRPYTTVRDEKIQIHEKLHQIINNQTITISIVDVRPAIKAFANSITATQPKTGFGFQQPIVVQTPQISANNSGDALCDVFIKVTETMANGVSRLIPSSMLTNFLKAEPLKSKLESELFVLDIVPQLNPSSKEISDYLNGPAPRGLDVELWEKVKQQCPNPNSLVPVPVIGMSELKARISGQVEFAQSQLNTIRRETEVVSEMKTKVVTMSGKIDQLKRKERELSNRILKVICRLEMIKKQGYSLSGDEESLKCSLDKLWSQLVGPYGIKSRLQEILSAPTGPLSTTVGKLSYNHMNNEAMDELKQYLSERQQSIKEMMTLIRENIACLNIVESAIL